MSDEKMNESQPNQPSPETSTETHSGQDRSRSIDPLGAAAAVPDHVIFPGPLPQPKKSRIGLIVLSVVGLLLASALFSVRWLPRAKAERLTSTNAGATARLLSHQKDRDAEADAARQTADDAEVVDAGAEADAEPEIKEPDPFMAFLESLPEAPTPAQLREKEFREATRQLRLQAVVKGTIPTATINDRTVSLGGMIEVPATSLHGPVKFRLAEIANDGRVVTVVAQDVMLGVTVEKVLELKKEP